MPADLRDLPGTFAHRYVVETRFGDTDAMGHVNNSRFLTFLELARIAYWEAVSGAPFALTTHGAEELMILAEVRITFRSPSYFGEVLTVESRVGRIGRTSVTLEHRITAGTSPRGAARLVATSDGVQVRYDYANGRPTVITDDIVALFEAYEGRPLRG